MKRKTIIYRVGALLFAVCIICGVMYATHREEAKNDVFTDAFFEDMTGISLVILHQTMLEGEAADSVVSYLKSLRLQPTEDTLPGDREVLYGGKQLYCVDYQDGTSVQFDVQDAMFKIRSECYYVVDKSGEPVTAFGNTLWDFFRSEV